ncbi:hypothetical protein FAM09_13335 [Niastella caeni]|uniref:Lipoprotein n=1 Tax=Niastella caeni TaxID=2569763 RepID=A0A4S8HW96_9BACT|nr:hypothetical protein [Niastella caeni]THU39481.1 hypothetical protein FAM09_13335 [Niastella caeni]
MKSKQCICLLLPFVLLLVFVACNKADNAKAEPENTSENANTFTTSSTGQCPNAPNYGDSIIYLQTQSNGADHKVQPLNNTGIQGTYLSWPEGLDINKNNGTINLAKSETGVRYKIGFVKKGTQDTCISQLILAGMTYMDSIYVLSQHDTLAMPIFNADPNAPSICDVSDDTDYPDSLNNGGNNKCAFDDDPSESANGKKLRVRSKSGVINLKKSLRDGLFGPNVKNGDSKRIKFSYRLNDGSKKAKQQITVEMIYYDKVSSIPASLQQEVRTKRQNMFEYRLVAEKPRPPFLVIAGLSY